MNRNFRTKIQGARFGNGRNEWNFPTGVLKIFTSLVFLSLNVADATLFAPKGYDWVSRSVISKLDVVFTRLGYLYPLEYA